MMNETTIYEYMVECGEESAAYTEVFDDYIEPEDLEEYVKNDPNWGEEESTAFRLLRREKSEDASWRDWEEVYEIKVQNPNL